MALFNWEYMCHNGDCQKEAHDSTNNFTTIVVVKAKSEEEAMLHVKSIAKRDHYHLVKVIQRDEE